MSDGLYHTLFVPPIGSGNSPVGGGTTVIKNEMSSVKYELCNIKPAPVPHSRQQVSIAGTNGSRKNNNYGDVAGDEAKTTLIIHWTLIDTARCKRNVIVSGLPESDTYHDMTGPNFCTFTRRILPSVTKNASMLIGKLLLNVPGRLLVRLGSEDTAEAVLRDACKPRLAPDTRNVFNKPDLSHAAATLAYKAQKK